MFLFYNHSVMDIQTANPAVHLNYMDILAYLSPFGHYEMTVYVDLMLRLCSVKRIAQAHQT